jgi:hypothetical protein
VFESECVICELPVVVNSFISVELLASNRALSNVYQRLPQCKLSVSPVTDAKVTVWNEFQRKPPHAEEKPASVAAALGYTDIDGTGPAADAADKLQRVQYAVTPMLEQLSGLTNNYFRLASAMNNTPTDISPPTDKLLTRSGGVGVHASSTGVNRAVDDVPDVSVHSNSSNVFPVISHSSQNKLRSGSSSSRHHQGNYSFGISTHNRTSTVGLGSWLTAPQPVQLARKIMRLVSDLQVIALQLIMVRFLAYLTASDTKGFAVDGSAW